MTAAPQSSSSGIETARAYIERTIASYAGDPADNQFQKGFLAALEVVRDEAFPPREKCPHCLGSCNPLPEGSGYCEKCQGTGWAQHVGVAQGSDGAACGDSSQASQRLSGDLQLAPSEADYLEDNIGTVAFHLGQPGVRLRVFRPGDGPGLIVDPGEVLKEISRRLGVAQGAPDYGKMSVDMAIEACAKVADDFAAYEQTIVERAHADGALSDTGRKNVVLAAGSRQVAAEQIAHDIRALSIPSTDRYSPEFVAEILQADAAPPEAWIKAKAEIDEGWPDSAVVSSTTSGSAAK